MIRQFTFHVKSQKQSSAKLYIYGSLPELGDGNPENGIPLDLDTSNPFSYRVTIEINMPKSQTSHGKSNFNPWYSYFFKTKLGSIVNEVCPKRFLNLSNCDSNSFYDTFDKATSINDLIVRFRVNYHTAYGQELYVTGDPKEMGAWNPRRAILLNYVGNDYWEGTVKLPLNNQPQVLYYKYIVFTSPRNFYWEGEENHRIEIGPTPTPALFEINDVYHWNDPTIDAYSTLAFINVINRRLSTREYNPQLQPPAYTLNNSSENVKIDFLVKCPYISPNQDLYILGSSVELGEWNPERGIKMNDLFFPAWRACVQFKSASLPFEYKYCIIDHSTQTLIWESRPNRFCPSEVNKECDKSFPRTIIINDWVTNPNEKQFKGFGITVPLSSILTKDSCGIGQYTDICDLVDYCNKIGSTLIQMLPINDTTTDGGWADSNPYRQTSAFALHPIYIDLLAIDGVDTSGYFDEIDAMKNKMAALTTINYPEVYKFKMSVLARIYNDIQSTLISNTDFAEFVSHNSQWLQPYSLFCYLRQKNGTPDFTLWPETKEQHGFRSQVVQSAEVTQLGISDQDFRLLIKENESELQFYYWIQYVCDYQLTKARLYAEQHRVILKTELPLGVASNSVECWIYPSLFNINMSSDPSIPSSSNNVTEYYYHRFNDRILADSPSYNWMQHATTDFSWWRLRLRRLSELFHAVELHNVFGFFKTWEVPLETCIRSILGHYEPALSFSKTELKDRGLTDLDRCIKPYVRWHHLQEMFGSNAENVASEIFKPSSFSSRQDQIFVFKEKFDTEVKILQNLNSTSLTFHDEEQLIDFQNKLFELLSNVLLIEDKTKRDHYHVRCQMMIQSVQKVSSSRNDYALIESTSWRELPESQRSLLRELYYEYYYRRQTQVWMELANPRFRMIKESTKMLVFADDLGDELDPISDNLLKRGLVTLRVQRVSKTPKQDLSNFLNDAGKNRSFSRRSGFSPPASVNPQLFDNIRELPYFSVATPSTTNMSPLRKWWEEDRGVITRFWSEEVWRHDEPPLHCEPWVQEIIIKQHLWANSMWALFLLQDIVGIDDGFRRQRPEEERFYDPQDPNHKWEYKYPYYIEELADNNELTAKIRNLIEASGRI